MEQENGVALGELIKKAYLAIKRNIFLVLAVILLITGGGVVVAYTKTPTYTATQSAVYKAEGEGTGSKENSEYTSAYFLTFVDFCNQGCVVDRANFYYDYYIKHQYKSVDDFIAAVDTVVSKDDPLFYDAQTDRVKESYIKSGNVTVSASDADSQTVSYMVGINYKDATPTLARDKVKILLCAIEKEANLENEIGQKTYFGVNVSVKDYEYKGVSCDLSKSKIIIIAAVLSVAVAAFAVYLVGLLDRTFRTKEDLEKITGSPVLAFIESTEV